MNITTVVYPGEAALPLADEFLHLRRLAARGCLPAQGDRHAAASALRDRMAEQARTPGFLAVTARADSLLCGFGVAARTPDPYTGDEWEGDARRAQEWLAGAVHVTDLVVAPVARGRGVATRLLETLTVPALDDRVWAAPRHTDAMALGFFRYLGWRQTVFPRFGAGPDRVVFLGPRHPSPAGRAVAGC
ncbi:GNAT family N-acetyltransferase [Streptomyces sp. NPDC014861]|uniref:GNAT family N-acetyltransferase n=1 Tax=Streptomyces sp. NPDC014861 TaxID=3364923 RepID=UPI0036FB2F1E